jgi:hypothetical protein
MTYEHSRRVLSRPAIRSMTHEYPSFCSARRYGLCPAVVTQIGSDWALADGWQPTATTGDGAGRSPFVSYNRALALMLGFADKTSSSQSKTGCAIRLRFVPMA